MAAVHKDYEHYKLDRLKINFLPGTLKYRGKIIEKAGFIVYHLLGYFPDIDELGHCKDNDMYYRYSEGKWSLVHSTNPDRLTRFQTTNELLLFVLEQCMRNPDLAPANKRTAKFLQLHRERSA